MCLSTTPTLPVRAGNYETWPPTYASRHVSAAELPAVWLLPGVADERFYRFGIHMAVSGQVFDGQSRRFAGWKNSDVNDAYAGYRWASQILAEREQQGTTPENE